jgi:raffinose/stachyose/melibiose transport system permease protein
MEIRARRRDIKSDNSLRFTRKRTDYLTIVLFLLPAFVLFFVFLVYPIIRSSYFSMFNWNGLGPAVNFVGADNYKRILTDEVFRKAVLNGLMIVVLSLTIQLPFALGLAIMIGHDLPGRTFFRMVFFLP